MHTDHEEVKQQIHQWLENVVIGLNLCPFAKRPFQSENLRVSVCDLGPDSITNSGDTLAACAMFVRDEIQMLLEHSPEQVETSLLAFPGIFYEFLEFWDFVVAMNFMLEDNGLDDIFQLASFHPSYVFEGEADGEGGDEFLGVSRSNYTNRSPVPLLHVLRQGSMTKAIQAYGEREVELIPERNMQTLNKLSEKQFSDLFANLLIGKS